MRICVFLNGLGLGGTEKAACRWAIGLAQRGHTVDVLSLSDGPRWVSLTEAGIEVRIVEADAAAIAAHFRVTKPDVIHTHAPGFPHVGDVLGAALEMLHKIPVVQTNIFGRLENPKEVWTDFRLFISWTSCVQAARRSIGFLNKDFFRRASVATYPLDPDDGPNKAEVIKFRSALGIQQDEIVFGRISRPEPNKWSDLCLEAFRLARREIPYIKLLLREAPKEVQRQLQSAADSDAFINLPATAKRNELSLTMACLDVVLHTSITGESFGYGLAEPMNFGKPVISNSTPWLDQAQIELVRHGEGGFIASSVPALAAAMKQLAVDAPLRSRLGNQARANIRQLADPSASLDRVEMAIACARSGKENPKLSEDYGQAITTAKYLDAHQFGHSLEEFLYLRGGYARSQAFRSRYLRAAIKAVKSLLKLYRTRQTTSGTNSPWPR